MYSREGRFPIKMDWQITTPEKLEAESNARDELYFNNEPVPEDTSDIVFIPHHHLDEFIERYNELINYFNNKP